MAYYSPLDMYFDASMFKEPGVSPKTFGTSKKRRTMSNKRKRRRR